MSKTMQLVAAISNAMRQIDDQISKLHSYQGEVDSVLQSANAVFSGSSNQYGQKMIDQLSKTKKKISDTINRLQNAKEKLSQIRIV